MNEVIILGIVPQGTEWLLILLVIVILFGASKLPQLAKALGQSKRAFKEGQAEAEEEARLEQAKRQTTRELSSATQPSDLSDIDDEQLFEEARRRAARARASELNQEKR